MQQSHSWAANRFSAIPEIPCILWRRLITVITSARNLSLSGVRSIQSMPRTHFLKIHFNITFSFTPTTSKWFFPPGFRKKKSLYAPLLSLKSAIWPAQFSLFDLINQLIYGEEYRSWSNSFWTFGTPVFPCPSYAQTFFSAPYSHANSAYVPPAMLATMFHKHIQKKAKL